MKWFIWPRYSVEPQHIEGYFEGGVYSIIWFFYLRPDYPEIMHPPQWLVQRPANQPDAASFMILTIVSSTSCATPSSCHPPPRKALGIKRKYRWRDAETDHDQQHTEEWH